MAKMKDSELEAILDAEISDSVSYNSEFMEANENYLKRYYQEPYGDEEAGFSQVIASDVRDTVDSDMTSLVRVFLGSGDVMSFVDVDDTQEAIEEAKQKTAVINHMILRRDSSYRVIHGFLKDVEIQKMGVLHYYCDTVKKTRESLKQGVTLEEITLLIEQIQEEDSKIKAVDIVEKEQLKDSELYNIRLRITYERKELVIKGIPTENFLLSRNASCLEEAQLVGHEEYPTRSELVANGMSEEEVNKFPTSNGQRQVSNAGDQQNNGTQNNSNAMQAIRWRDEGGDIIDKAAYNQWANQKVHQVLAFVYVDYDGDGIAERRRILRIGGKVIENEPYDHEPYAVASAILDSHKAIGNGRASLVIQDQSVNTELERGILDNIYDVQNPRTLLGNGVDHDDFYDDRRSGVVRMKNNAKEKPSESIFAIPTQFVGDAVMMVKQNRDQTKAARTGSMLENQSLTADNLNEETATRFRGIERAGQAKIELVCRNIAEVGLKKLYAGIEWTLSRFFDEELKERLNNGKAMRVNPSMWKHETRVVSKVGLGAASGERAVQQLYAQYEIQLRLREMGSLLVDDQKIYNTLALLTQMMDLPNTSNFYNNPEAPQELIFAQYQQLVGIMEQQQAELEQLSQENPLAEAETIRAKAMLLREKNKTQLEAMKADLQTRLKEMEMIQKKAFHESDKVYDYAKLELEHNTDLPGVGFGG